MQKNVEVVIERIIIQNFRKISFLDLVLDNHVNWLVGTNEVGKSTVANAHSWLWSQYDRDNMEAYEIRPKAEDGTTPYKNVSSVEEYITVIDHQDGSEYSMAIKRELVDKWDDETDTCVGMEQVFYIDGLKTKTKTQFMEKIDNIVSTDVFRIMTSPTFFLTMKNDDMRKRILELVGGDISDEELLSLKPEYEKLVGLLKKKSIEDYFKEVKQSLSAVEKQKIGIPAAMNEVKLAISKLSTKEQFDELEKSIQEKQKELDGVELLLKGLGEDPAVAAHEKLKVDLSYAESGLQLFVGKFNNELATKNSQIEAKRIPIRGEIGTLNAEISNLKNKISSNQQKLSEMKVKFDGFTAEWLAIDQEEFVEPQVGGACPTCGKPFTQDEVNATLDTAESAFNESKIARKSEVRAKGEALMPTKKALDEEITVAMERIPVLEAKVSELQVKLDAIKSDESKAEDQQEYATRLANVNALKEQVAAPPKVKDADQELINKKETLTEALRLLNQAFGQKAVLESNEQRLEQLVKDEQAVNEAVLKWKKAKHVVESYLKDKSSVLEEKVNAKFEIVQFQLFEFTNDGTPKLVCIPKVKGAYYPVVNTAGKTAAYIDVAKTFGQKYGVTLPVFIDNKESVVDKNLPQIDAQKIFLHMDEKFPTLTLTSQKP